jgi:hypothetical protein
MGKYYHKTRPPGLAVLFYSFPSLSHQLQLINNILCAAKLIYAPKHVTYVNANGPVKVFVKGYFMA